MGFLQPSSLTLITELSPWELPLRRILPSNSASLFQYILYIVIKVQTKGIK